MFEEAQTTCFASQASQGRPLLLIQLEPKRQHMSILVNLPHSLLYSILDGWLELHSVTKLDTAVCNRSLRECFTKAAFQECKTFTSNQYFGKPKSRMHHLSDEKSEELMKWALTRKVPITDIAVTNGVKNDAIFRRALLDFLGNRITRVNKWTLQYGTYDNFREILEDICERCPNVNHICCSKDFDTAAYERIGKKWPSLGSIQMGYKAKDCDFAAIGKHYKSLTHIRISTITELSSKVLCNLLQNIGATLQSILGISVSAHEGDEIMRAIAKYCPKLREIEVKETELIVNQRVHWKEVFEGCPQLNDVHICAHSGTSALLAVAQAGATLEHLRMTAIASLDSYALRAVTLKCPNLRTLSIYDQYRSIDDEALIDVADRCPLLEELSVMWLSPESTSDAAAFALAKTLRKLTHLALPGSGITDAGLMAVLAMNPGIVRLNVYDCRGITDKTMKALPQLCPYISDLTTYKCKVKIAGVHAVLQGCKHLYCFEVPAHLRKKAEEAVETQYKGKCRPGLQFYRVHSG